MCIKKSITKHWRVSAKNIYYTINLHNTIEQQSTKKKWSPTKYNTKKKQLFKYALKNYGNHFMFVHVVLERMAIHVLDLSATKSYIVYYLGDGKAFLDNEWSRFKPLILRSGGIVPRWTCFVYIVVVLNYHKMIVWIRLNFMWLFYFITCILLKLLWRIGFILYKYCNEYTINIKKDI